MTAQQPPISPPQEEFKQWEEDIFNERENVDYVLDCAWRNGFQAGADQELEACCHYFARDLRESLALELRAARRPKPPSLKEQARSELIDAYNAGQIDDSTYDTIRRALEALPDG